MPSTNVRRSAQAIVTLWLAAIAAPAHAYLDPGTGSLMVQMAIGALAAAGTALSVYWQRLRRWLGRPSSPVDRSGRDGPALAQRDRDDGPGS